MGLRNEHRRLTHSKIVDAVLALVADGSLDELSMPAVAKRSGVSLATIYRYFPTKDDLIAAAAEQPARAAYAVGDTATVSDDHPDDDVFARFQRALWHDFSHNVELLRHQISSTAGREMRRARLERGRRQLAAYVTDQGVDPASPSGERLISMLLLVSGSLALVELHDRQEHSVDDALDISVWAVHTLIDATRTAQKENTPS